IMTIGVIYSNFNGEAYRAKGKPNISFLYQVIHLLFLIPVLFYSKRFGFWPLVYSRVLIRIQGTVTGFIFMKKYMGFSIKEMLFNLVNPMICSGIMILFCILVKRIEVSIFHSFLNILLCGIVY